MTYRYNKSIDRRRLIRSSLVATGGIAGAGLFNPAGRGVSAFTSLAHQESPTGELNFAKPGKVRTKDPNTFYGLNEFVLLRNVFEPLVDLDQNGQLYPVLAESWEPSEDGLTWTFNLRQGVTFHDGTPFNADSVAATIGRCKDNTKSGFAFVFRNFADPPVTIVDEYTVQLHTAVPIAPLLNNIVVLYMVPPSVGENLEMDWEDGIGTGPFRITDFSIDEQYVLQAYDGYWNPEFPKLSKVTYRPILDQSALVAALRAGQADLIEGISEENVQAISGDSSLQVIRSTLWQTDFLTLNGSTNPSLAIPEVRRAINYAIDREVIATDILSGNAQPLASYPPRGILGYNEIAPIVTNPYNPEQAIAELAAAGLSDGFEAVLKVPHGQFTKDAEIAEFVAQQLGEIGISIELDLQEPVPALQSFIDGDYEIGYAGSIAVTGDPDRYLQERIVGDLYHTGFPDEEAKELVRQAGSTIPTEERQTLYEQAAALIWQQPPFIYLHQINWNYAAKTSVTNFTWMPNRIFNFSDTTLE